MLAYEYLKQNPKQNARFISSDWEQLFTDAEVPFSVKEQLRQMEKYSIPLNDVNIYWYERGLYHELTGQFNGGPKLINQQFWHQRHWLDKLYTYAQEYHAEHAWDLFFHLSVNSCVWDYKPTMEEVVRMGTALIKHGLITDGNIFVTNVFLYAISNPPIMRNWALSSRITDMCRYMSWQFLSKLGGDQEKFNRVHQLCMDAGDPPQKKYESLNELERAHDERTEHAVQSMLNMPSNKRRIIYTADFKGIIEKHGFTLPATRNSLIERGARHHNCVATYADKHLENPSSYASKVSRLIFDPDTTAELVFHFNFGKIYNVILAQYKGRYNKDGKATVGLLDVIIELTGQSVEILNVSIEEGIYAKEEERGKHPAVCDGCCYLTTKGTCRPQGQCPRRHQG